jgi:uncharacterized protein YecE (DUF72 family)
MVRSYINGGGMRIYIGTSGWAYKDWRGRFYPQNLPQTKWLSFYTQHFATVELNNTFYQLPSEKAFHRWKETAPPSFVYAVKVSRLITHLKKLRNTQDALANFLSRARLLGEKLGPLLYQLPPSLSCDQALLEEFLQLLPQDLSYIFEFRHPSWFSEKVFEQLSRHQVGLCLFDMPELTTPLVATTDLAYIRFHGSQGLYQSSYPTEELQDWAQRIASLGKDLREIYIYFNNDFQAVAVNNALTLRKELSDLVGEEAVVGLS